MNTEQPKSLSHETDADVTKLRDLIDEAESLLAEGGEKATEEYEKLRERFNDALASGKERFKQASDMARKQAARADEAIHQHPYTAIGIAAGLGLLTGYLVSRSCNCKR